jgi:hypothetical protein
MARKSPWWKKLYVLKSLKGKIMHLVHGDTLAGCISCQGIKQNDILVFQDDLMYGPLFSVKHNERCFQQRKIFWEIFLGKKFGDVHNEYSALKRNEERLLADESIIIWCLNDTRGKLFFLWLVNTLEEFGVDFQKISFFRLDSEEYISILRQPTIRMELGAEGRIKKEDFSKTQEVWNLLVSNNPDKLTKYLAMNSYVIFFDHSNLLECLYRYPFPRSGINQIQYRLLKIIKKNDKINGSKLLLKYINKYESRSCSHTDKIIYYLIPLSQKKAGYPLIKIENQSKLIFRSNISITDFGLKALEGNFNHILHNGIDVWVLGKHFIYPGSSICYFDGEKIIEEAKV